MGIASFCASAWAGTDRPAEQFRKTVQPILSQYCFDCHADGSNKGKVAFDEFKSDQDLLGDTELWWKVLKNVRAGIMPPQKHPQPTDSEKRELVNWIKYGAFALDPAAPDPGRVTLRRLNRVEYRNTIRDLMGVDFNTTEEFPPDDTGYGFDTIGDVLNVSPMLLEKYMQAAEKIVNEAVPTVARSIADLQLYGNDFRGGGANGAKLSFYRESNVAAKFTARRPGSYHLTLNMVVRGSFDFDPGECDAAFTVDGAEQWHEHLKWESGKKLQIDFDRNWQPGEHRFAFEIHPLKEIPKEPHIGPNTAVPTTVDLQVVSLDIQGPMEKQYWAETKNFDRYFPREEVPADPVERKTYARQVIAAFAKKAFRRPADDHVLGRLVEIYESTASQSGKTFFDGVKEAMVAVLSSPRFVFRVEKPEPGASGSTVPLDEYSLASRLSYFLWSTMPDDELMSLADHHALRAHLNEQLKRMLKDPRSQELVSNFTGQWLELRDVEGININVFRVLRQDNQPLIHPTGPAATQPARQVIASAGSGTGAAAGGGAAAGVGVGTGRRDFGLGASFRIGKNGAGSGPLFKLFGVQFQLDSNLRRALREEPEMLFAEIMRNDESIAQLLDTDHTYLNEKLAALYKVDGVAGPDMRRVDLPKESPRGGLLTMGAVLIVTSNPTRTSPVKRGQFILDNMLGMPTPPPPAAVPALEASERNSAKTLSFRQVLEIHRSEPLCASCHGRLDPLGLSLENFDAIGMWRDKERGLPIDAAGQLLTGESFHDAHDVKGILIKNHLPDFYRCLTEKMLTYALGRGMEAYDVETVDQIVERLQHENGRFSALIEGIVDSAAFQRRRNAKDRMAGAVGPVAAEPQTGNLSPN
ncbi:MAG TPA: DUF1592 domain-containing protein [Tepidisphaeraceae bacterium]